MCKTAFIAVLLAFGVLGAARGDDVKPSAGHGPDTVFAALSAAADGDFNTALTALNRQIISTPESPEAWAARGRVYDMMGKFDLALNDLDKATSLESPDQQTSPERADVVAELAALKAALLEPTIDRSAKAIGRTHDCSIFYSPLSLGAGEQGTVTIQYDVLANGTIANVIATGSSGSDRLDRAATLCVRTRWRSLPAIEHGVAVNSLHRLALIQFHL